MTRYSLEKITQLIRLESKKGRIVATLFDEEELDIATHEHMELC